MKPVAKAVAVTRLVPGESLRVRDAVGCTVVCSSGKVWITQEKDSRDTFLREGQSFTLDRPGLALICAEGGEIAAIGLSRYPPQRAD